MKILFTANRFPYPPYRGDKLKIFHLAKRLAQRHEVHLLTFLQDKSDLRHLPELEKVFKEIHLVPLRKSKSYFNSLMGIFRKVPVQVAYFHSAAMAAKVKQLKENDYDVVHVQHLRMAQYWAAHKEIPRVLDLPDAYSLYWKRRVASKKHIFRLFAQVEQKKVFDYENVLKEYDLSLVCSKEDQLYLEQFKELDNIALLPNGVDLSTFSGKDHDYNQDRIILFTGNMDYAPNVDAVLYFSHEIFPLIKQEVPHARFVIAGQRPVKKVRNLASQDIEVTGFVKNLSEMYARASIVVAPLRFGAGTQNKVLEALAMGVPVVTRNVGFDGLNIRSGEGAILATTTDDFASACVSLLQSASLRRSTGEQGKRRISEQFDWDVIARQLEDYFHGLVR